MSHYYFDPETKTYFPSVTTILQTVLPEPEGITLWKARNKNWKKLLTESADTGTLVHFAILNPLSGYCLDASDLLPMYKWYSDTVTKLELSSMMFQQLIKTKHLQFGFPRRVESKILNRKEKYSGKFDLCCPLTCPRINNEKILFDIKTSSAVRETHLLQLGGYFMSFPEDERPDRVAIIKITPDAWKNPKLEAELHVYPKSKAEEWGNQFIELARTFHAENMHPSDDNIETMD
jgi:hypothetical protein